MEVFDFNFDAVKQSLISESSIDTHKGTYGSTLLLGGDHPYGGAIILAAGMALRIGSGLVTVATHSDYVTAMLAHFPSVIVAGVNNRQDAENLCANKDIIICGPGLKDSSWSQQLTHLAIEIANKDQLPLILDAGSLLFLHNQTKLPQDLIITPHPGEAANLLDCEVNDIQNNRTHAAKKLQEKFGGIIVLKGKETLITDKDNMFRCMNGNPLLSSAGTGDVLTGFIGGLIAQGISPMEACKFAVAAHGDAVDQLKREDPLKNRGITASDLISLICQSVFNFELNMNHNNEQ